jgi:putative tryptophan/tyrosine transport system substrate-binding protein
MTAPAMPVSRRAALAVLLAFGILAPAGAFAQQPPRAPRVGVIGERSASDPFLAAFRRGMSKLGHVDGRNITIEYRYAQGALDQVPRLAAELVDLKVDVLVVGGTVSTQSAMKFSRSVPIVFTTVGDPVGSGIVVSLARPGGNVTGLSSFTFELGGKQLELLHAAVPRLSRVTVLYNPLNSAAKAGIDTIKPAADTLGIELQLVEVRQPDKLAGAFSALTPWRPGGLLVLSDPVFGGQLPRLAKLAAAQRLPAIYLRSEFAEAGGLLAYGPSFADNYRRAATYVDKILKGTKPADLPVEQPTKFDLAVNLKTARTFGLTLPQELVGRADQIIQ